MIGAWIEQGLCRQQGNHPDWWWPESNDDRTAMLALNICQRCPVRKQCLDHALAKPEEFGIWGGLLPEARRRARALENERHAGPGVVGLSLMRLQDSPPVTALRRQILKEVTA